MKEYKNQLEYIIDLYFTTGVNKTGKETFICNQRGCSAYFCDRSFYKLNRHLDTFGT